jgi:hypothetical protein
MFKAVCQLGLESLVSKRLDAPLSLRPVKKLDQGQESESTGSDTRTGRDVLIPLRRKVEPLLMQCAAIDAEIGREEALLPEIVDRKRRAEARVQLVLKRAKLQALVYELQSTEEKFMRLADQRFPQWRT